MGFSIIAPPSCEPLHINDVRQHVKQDITDDDNLIEIYLGSARAYAEELTRKQFIAARYQYKFDAFPTNYTQGFAIDYDVSLPGNAILLPKAPLIEVESIQYIDTGGNQQTVSSADYVIDAISEPARITPVFGKIWPISRPQIGAVWVTFKAGYIDQAVFDATADTIAVKNWRTLVVSDVIRLSNSGGVLPAVLKPKTDYYVQTVVSPGVYKLSATNGGAAINIADIGTGLHFLGQPGISFSPGELPSTIKAWMLLRCDTHYSHRGETVNTRGGEITPLPYVDRLLDHDRNWQ
jgi:uncharacterized phiE125 gp8 family phage protein